MVRVGAGALTDHNARLNTVPLPELPLKLAVQYMPPAVADPYRVLPYKINPASGLAPSLLVERVPEVAVKPCKFVKLVPSVLKANTVPLPELPPRFADPYRVLPDKIKPPSGLAPSLLV